MSFDPYHRWLGIPPGEQPPNHYRLLGIAPLEDDPDVIEVAADRQMGHLRHYQSGEHSALSQKLLGEVVAAKVCLLDPQKKAEYDSRLREQVEAAKEAAAMEPAEPLDSGMAQLLENTAHAPAVSPRAGRRANPTQLWASAGIIALGVVALIVILIRASGSSHPTTQSDGKSAAVQGDRQKPPKAPALPKSKLDSTGPKPAPAANEPVAESWVDVGALADPGLDRVEGEWSRDGGDIVMAARPYSRLMLPVDVKGSYDLATEFTRASGAWIAFVLPVGQHGCCLDLSAFDGGCSGLEMIDGWACNSNGTTVKPGTLVNGHRYKLLVKVRLEGEQATINAILDGKPYVNYSGNASSLRVQRTPPWSVPIASRPALAGFMAAVRFHSVRLRPVGPESGLKLARSTGRGRAAPPVQPGASPPPLAVAPFDAAKAKGLQQRWARHLGTPVVGANSIGMRFVLVPPGEFDMGSSKEEVARVAEEARKKYGPTWDLERLPAESPKHRVKITRPFYLGLCEVTQAEYQRVMGENPSTSPGAPDLPVDGVPSDKAVEFCRKLSDLAQEKSAGAAYRLPTEAEWEYACRAGTTTRYSFGDDPAILGRYAQTGALRPVARLLPNAWGLFDMLGNAREWCADYWSEDYYAKSPSEDPRCSARSRFGRVARGRLWGWGPPEAFRSAGRATRPGVLLGGNGFRVAMTVAPGSTALRPASPPQPSIAPAPVVVQTAPTFDDWLQDFEAAKGKAAAEKKDILVTFDGSDWCGWSMRLASEVFFQRRFRQQVDKDYVLVFIDFPERKEAKAKVQDAARNKRLADTFGIESYPTVVLADAQGRPYGVEGYVRGGVEAFVRRLAKWREVKAKRDEAFALVDKAQGGAKLKAVRKAVGVLQQMDRQVGGIGLLRFYEPALAEWLAVARKLDPDNAAGDLEAVFVAACMAKLDAARQSDDPKPLDEVVRQLDEWKKRFKFKDPDQAVMLYLRAAQVLMFAGRSADAAKIIEEANHYKPTNPLLAWALERAARWMTEGFGHGTGFVVAEGGYVLTNHHVIAGRGKLLVQLSPDPKDRVPARVIGDDEKGDMALLKIDVPKGRRLRPLAISGAEVRRGMTIGAFGYGGAGDVGTGIKLTQGIVSSLPDTSTEGMIVLDCRVNPGNSGGPLCDTRGNVIGMITAKSLSSERFESYGMALPAEKLQKFLAGHLPKGHKPPQAEHADQTRQWDEIDRLVSGSVLKVVKGM